MFPILSLIFACQTSTTKVDDTGEVAAGPTVTLLAGDLDTPLDATPSPDGEETFFVTDGASGSALFQIDADGAVSQLAALSGARGLVAAEDGRVFIADPGADGLFAYDPAYGLSASLDGTNGSAPTALALDGETLVFAGINPTDGASGLMRVSMEGGVVETLSADFPAALDGVAVGPDGAVYAAGGGSVFALREGAVSTLAEGLTLGSPAGLALTPDDSTLMVSSLSDSGTSQVVLINLASGESSIFDDVISANHASGGLHRAAAQPAVYAWADSSSGGGVYRVRF